MTKSIAQELTSGSPKKLVGFGLAIGILTGIVAATVGWSVPQVFWTSFQTTLLIFLALIAIRIERRLNFTHTAASKASERATYAQAMPKLYEKLEDLPYPVPVLDEWTLEPSGILLLDRLIKEHQPRAIAEFGSGATTPVLALLADRTNAEFYSVEESEQWTQRTRQRLKAWGLPGNLVHHIPLITDTADQDLPWYQNDQVQALFDGVTVDLVLVDGPTSKSGRHIRRPVLDYMKKYLSEDAILVLDDYNRIPEREVVEIWKQEMPNAEVQVIPGQKEKEIAVFKINGS